MQAFTLTISIGCFAAGTLAAVGMANAMSAPAKIPDSTTGEITACMVKKTGDVRFINAQKAATCTRKEKTITFNQTGPVGKPGEPGVKGDTGDRGPSNGYVAQLNGLKTISESAPAGTNNVVSLQLPAGNYIINASASVHRTDSDTDVINCRFTAATGTLNSTTARWDTQGNLNDEQPFAVTGSYTSTEAAQLALICVPVIDGLDNSGSGEVSGATIDAVSVDALSGP